MPGGALLFSGRRQPSCDGMSRMMREYHVGFCEGLGVKFPGPTRHKQTCGRPELRSALPPTPDILAAVTDFRLLTQNGSR